MKIIKLLWNEIQDYCRSSNIIITLYVLILTFVINILDLVITYDIVIIDISWF